MTGDRKLSMAQLCLGVLLCTVGCRGQTGASIGYDGGFDLPADVGVSTLDENGHSGSVAFGAPQTVHDGSQCHGSGSPQPSEAALPVNDFLNSIGVAIANTSTYAYALNGGDNTVAAFKETGIRRLRTADGVSTLSQRLRDEAGIMITPVVFATSNIDGLLKKASVLGGLEGPNEIDGFFNSDVTTAVNIQKAMWTAITSSTDATVRSIPVLSFTIANPNKFKSYTNATTGPSLLPPVVSAMQSNSNLSAIHIYTQWFDPLNAYPSGVLEGNLPQVLTMFNPNKPLAITEFGWWTQPVSNGVTEGVTGPSNNPTGATGVGPKYLLNFFLDAFRIGIRQSYVYELNDEWADDASNTDIERHFGLYDYTWKPKGTAIALRNLTTILKDSRSALAGSLAFSLSGMPTTTIVEGNSQQSVTRVTGRHLLLRKSDGTFVLAVWNDTLLWDNSKEHSVDPVSVTLKFTDCHGFDVYDPLVGTNSVATVAPTTTATISVPDHPVLLFIH